MNPETRTLRYILEIFENYKEAERWFSTLMGDDTQIEEIIEDNAVYATIDVYRKLAKLYIVGSSWC